MGEEEDGKPEQEPMPAPSPVFLSPPPLSPFAKAACPSTRFEKRRLAPTWDWSPILSFPSSCTNRFSPPFCIQCQSGVMYGLHKPNSLVSLSNAEHNVRSANVHVLDPFCSNGPKPNTCSARRPRPRLPEISGRISRHQFGRTQVAGLFIK